MPGNGKEQLKKILKNNSGKAKKKLTREDVSSIRKELTQKRDHHGIDYEQGCGEFIGMNYAKSEKHPESKNIHCFVDDYQFVRYWNTPDRYIAKLKQFRSVCSPDFSTYTDMPVAMQIYNHYRKHWLAAYWQMHGITVYPTISWSSPDSYEWCFDGEPEGGIVAVSSIGTQKSKESKRLFLLGYEEMMKRLNPSYVIFYGYVPIECDWNVIPIKAFQEKFKGG